MDHTETKNRTESKSQKLKLLNKTTWKLKYLFVRATLCFHARTGIRGYDGNHNYKPPDHL